MAFTKHFTIGTMKKLDLFDNISYKHIKENVILLLLGLLDVSTLVFTLILLYSLWSVTMDHGINKAVLTLMRYIVDSDFAKRFDEENNN